MHGIALLLALLMPDVGTTAPAPRAIAVVLSDANADHIPDALGDRVTVAGRASVSFGQLGNPGAELYLQDASGGIGLRQTGRADLLAGDSLVVTGVVGFRNGAAHLTVESLRRVGGTGTPPVPMRVVHGELDAVEGRLVVVDATVVGHSHVEAGEALMLTLPDHSMVVAFAFARRGGTLSFDGLAPGDRVRLTGVASQFDRVPPYTESYQIYPRSPADVVQAGIPKRLYQTVAFVGLGLLLLAMGWVALLRHQVARRVAQLDRSEDRYRKLVEKASDAVFVHSFEGSDAELNHSARAALGLRPDDPVPNLFEAIAPEDHATVRQHLLRLRQTGSARADIHLLDGDGVPRPYEVESQILALDGADAILSLARDVGARRAYEQGLIDAREQAEEMARLKSAFLASMSHEIRTPLTAVLGFAEVLLDEVHDDQRDLVEAISSGGHRLLATLNSVLDVARLDAGSEQLHASPFDLTGQLRRSLALLDALASKRGLALTFETTAELMPVQMDAGAMDRVLINLVGNAIKFTETGSVDVRVVDTDDTITLTVRDTGIGMDASFLPDLFSEFRQESEGEARSYEGTGLGMAITKKLVDLMNGEISVESTKGVGSTFTVTLPRGLSGDSADVPIERVVLVEHAASA
jgi:PAS domain S-box-containing protein